MEDRLARDVENEVTSLEVEVNAKPQTLNLQLGKSGTPKLRWERVGSKLCSLGRFESFEPLKFSDTQQF